MAAPGGIDAVPSGLVLHHTVCNRGQPRRSHGSAQDLLEKFAHFRRIARHGKATFLHDGELGIGRVGPAGDQCPGMAHALARRRGDARDEADHRLFHVGFAPARGFGFVRAADLADHDDRIGIGVVVERPHDVDVLETVDRVATDAHRAALAQPEFGDLRHRLVSERARARDDADATLAVNVSGHDADLDFIGRNQAGTVRPEQQGLLATGRLLVLHAVAHQQHVLHGNALGDADRQIEIGLHRLPDGGSRACRGHIDDGNRGARGCLGVGHGAVNGNALEIFAGLFRVDTGDEAVLAIGIVAAHAGMKLPCFAGDALGDDLGVLIDQDSHVVLLFCGGRLRPARHERRLAPPRPWCWR